jgi:hypothetical protein
MKRHHISFLWLVEGVSPISKTQRRTSSQHERKASLILHQMQLSYDSDSSDTSDGDNDDPLAGERVGTNDKPDAGKLLQQPEDFPIIPVPVSIKRSNMQSRSHGLGSKGDNTVVEAQIAVWNGIKKKRSQVFLNAVIIIAYCIRFFVVIFFLIEMLLDFYFYF